MPLSNGSMEIVHFAVAEQTGAIAREGDTDVSMLGMQSNGLGQIVLAQTTLPVFNVIKVVFPEDFDDDTYYWTGHTFAKYPPRPDGMVRWSGTGWTVIESEPVPEPPRRSIEQARDETSLVKTNLLANIMLAKLITPEQMIEASNGIPAFMMQLLNTFPPEARAIAIVRWSSATLINRRDPIIILAGYSMGLTDEQLDDFFEVKV